MGLNKKIRKAKKVIKKHYELNDGKLFISFSGGKDSTILRHMVLSMYPNLPVVFSNTTNELQEILKYVKTFDNVVHVHPKLSFSQVIKKYGFPLVSKEVSQKVNDLKHTRGKRLYAIRKYGYQNHPDSITNRINDKGEVLPKKGSGKLPNKWQFLAKEEFNTTHKCCAILKKNPLENYAKEHDLKPIIALMFGESRLRSQLALYGNDDGKKIYPFLKTGWTEKDIWKYANKNNIRFAECYYDTIKNGELIEARDRTGCEYCAFGIHLEKKDRFKRSEALSPKRFKKMMDLTNNNITFRDAIDKVKNK